MSKHSKHSKHHAKEAGHKAKAPKTESLKTGEQNDSLLAAPEGEGENSEAKGEDKAEDSEEGVFRNVAELNGKKSGGHEPVSFIPPNPPMDHSAQASLSAHKAAEEDKDPADVQQELTHKEILAGALDPSSTDSDEKDKVGAGEKNDAAVGEDAPADPLAGPAPAADKENAGQETADSAPVALTQPSSDGSATVDPIDPNAPQTDADAGATPSAS